VSEQLNRQFETLVPASIAARQVGYTCDYITRLARAGKIAAEKVGRQWHVDLQAVLDYAREAQEKSEKRKSELRASRKVEYMVLHKDREEEMESAIRTGKMFALAQACLVVVGVLTLGASGYFSTHEEQLASVIHIEIDITPIERTALSLYYFISPNAPGASEFVQNGDESQRTQSYDITVVSEEDRVRAIRDAFSDDVEVSFDVDVSDSGVITPRFRDDPGGEYRFKLLLEAQGGSGGGQKTGVQ